MSVALITGAGGFIGSHLVKKICSHHKFSKVVALKRGEPKAAHFYQARKVKGVLEYGEMWGDLKRECDVRAILNQTNPDYIFHLAGNPNTKINSLDKNGGQLWQTNVDSTYNLLAYAPPKCRFVLASSATVYGNLANEVGACTENIKPNPTSIYGASKVAAETLVDVFTKMGKVRGLSLRYVATVGQGATHGLIPDVVKKLRSDTKSLELIGQYPGSVKPFMHVEDVANLTIDAALIEGPTVVNLSPPDALTVEQVASAAMRVMGIYKEIVWLGEESVWPGDNPFVWVNNQRMSYYNKPKYTTSLAAVEQAVRDLI